MMQYDVSILTAFALYLLAMLAIGVYYSRSREFDTCNKRKPL